ncbi:MAG: T9SS type A sorting domain-containing protein [candidate division WOR-3 bacterium]|nr:T9SS type A sorting domain-containing protein [candidate division WOR-3 bacterium]
MRRSLMPIYLLVLFVQLLFAQVETLPAPIIKNKSFEILSNSRYSVHSGFTSSLSRQILSNILWSMNKAPRLGSYREIYVATPANVYKYDSTNHCLVLHLAGNHRYSPNSAFEIGVATERHEETGFIIQSGLLAGTAFRDSNVATCPMKYAADYANNNWNPLHPIKCVNVFGRYSSVPALDTTCLAISSDSSLPLPRTNRADTFEIILSSYNQDSVFSASSLSLQNISQLAWAGYGVTPHMTINNRRGLTVPSAVAAYYLTRKIYIVRDVGVFRYHNRRPPGTGLSTADHRLELITAEDRRGLLRAASSRIPSTAPVYFVICVGDTLSYGPMQEAGFVGFQLLMQAQALRINGYLTVPLNITERTAIINALSIPTTDIPVIVFSCGEPLTSVNQSQNKIIENEQLRVISLKNGKIKIEYRLTEPGMTSLAIYDIIGRLVYSFEKNFQNPGYYSVEWNKKGLNNQQLSSGVYIGKLISNNKVNSVQFVLTE